MKQKRIISFIVTLCMLLGLMIPGTYAENISADIMISAQMEGAMLFAPGSYNVEAGLAEKYGYTYDDQITENDITTLDALVKAHEMIFADAFTKDTASDYLVVDEGMISKIFGVDTINVGYTVNGVMPHTDDPAQETPGLPDSYVGLNIQQAKINADDRVDFFIYQDDMCMDYYTSFEYNGKTAYSIDVTENTDFTLSLKGYRVAWYGLAEEGFLEENSEYLSDCQIGTLDENGSFTAIDGAVTDEDGNAVLNLTKGDYIISAIADPDGYNMIISPYISVTVTENQTVTKSNEEIAKEMSDAISNDYLDSKDPWIIAEMTAYGRKDDLTKSDEFIAEAKEAAPELKNVIALTALGENAAAIQKGDGTTVNMIEELAKGSIPYITSAAYLLQAYDSGDYEVCEGTADRETLISYFLEQQSDDGSWSGNYGADTTAMILPALSNYTDRAEVKTAVDNAVQWLSEIQTSKGDYQNSNATALVITALSALGINADTDERFIKDGKSAVDGLLAYRTENSKFGWTDNTSDNAMATEQGFRALVSWLGMIKANGAYNIFSFTNDEEQQKTVTVRIEGISENKLYIKDMPLDDNIVTAADIIKSVVPAEDLVVTDGSWGAYISSIYGEAENTFGGENFDGWQYMVNNKAGSVGISDYIVQSGDDIVFYYGGINTVIPSEPVITYPAHGRAKIVFTAEVTEYGPAPDYTPTVKNVPIEGAAVTIGEGKNAIEKITNSEGSVTINIEKGTYPIQMEKYDTVEIDGKYLPLTVRYAPDKTVQLDITSEGGGSSDIDDFIDVTFTLIGDTKHEEVAHKLFKTWISKTDYTVEKGSTVKDVFVMALDEAEIEYELDGKNYIKSINGLAEFDNGPNSGWMYKVNEDHPTKPINEYTLKNGDEITFHYSDDYTEEDNDDDDDENNQSGSGGGGGSGTTGGSYLGIAYTTVTFTLIGDSKHGENPHEAYETWMSEKSYVLPVNATVKVLLEKALGGAGIEYVIDSDNYVTSIKGLSALDNGPNSGWMYKINGEYSQQPITSYILKNNDKIVFNYVDDYTTETNISNNGKYFFNDVSQSHWANEYIYYLAGKKIINGKSETVFAPDDNITRAEFVTILFRMYGHTAPEITPVFDDVSSDDWFCEAVSWAVDAGITNGINEKTFAPNDNISREQMAVMIVRFTEYMNYTLEETETAVTLGDQDSISDWALDAVSKMRSSGIISGNEQNMFMPKNNATRAEASKIIAMVLQEQE